MLHATWRSLMGRKLRLLLSAFSIVLGIAFVSGSLMFTNLLGSSFNSILKSGIADVNVSSGGGAFNDTSTGPQATVTPELLEKISALDGVVEATGVVMSTGLYPLDKDGKVLAFGGAPGIGTNWYTTPAAGGAEGARVIDGRAPEKGDELAIDPSTMERGGYAVGDRLKVSTPKNGIRTYTIVGTATFGSGATAGASYLFFTLDEMRDLVLDGAKDYSAAWIATAPGADAQQITTEVSKLLPEGLTAVSGQEQADTLEKQLSIGLSFINTFLLVFAAIALVVASLLILNTFSILVAQRSRELALLRALGAKRNQVRNSVLLEAAVIGFVGATIGIAAGYGLTALIGLSLGFFGIDIGTSVPTLTWQAVATSYVLALIITMFAAWAPARKASATRPVEAMTAAAAPTEAMGTGVHIGFALIILGAASVVCGVLFDGLPQPLVWAGVGCVAVLIGCVLAAAVIGRPIVWLFGRLYKVMFGEVGKIAERNATRQPRRTAATASTLTIGLALVTTVTILASSTTTSVRAGLTDTQRGDFLMSPVNFRPFDRKVADAAAKVEGVEKVWTFSNGPSVVDGEPVFVTGTTPDGVTEGTALDVLAGQLNPEGGSALLSMDESRALDLPLGRTFTLPTLKGGTIELLVTGIFDGDSDPSQRASIIVNMGTFEQVADASLVSVAKIKVAPGADHEAVRAGLEKAAADLPTVVVTDNAEYADSLVGQFGQIFAVINALLALAIVISVLGIVNTLGLSVMERTREIGLLRAVGMTRPQLRRVIRLESVVVAVLGSLLGVALGLGFGVVLVRLLRDSGITELSISWWQLALYVVVAALFGVLAAIGPARRASRMNILESIAMD
ncbi:ABC transporter permease [Tessaracoccus antarcticus]|uniref:FtsX-like permease family protein n=1 Tax=Tessaracoccus antarcticus TaxID=2479848 RepID=A0A3M0GVY8_9ACTN|nr:FtsX-like permease family protein [Tessaracoccus antarcticus]RMB61506.1 FtsX-like permease family protein [Tessaracoccus antarcticus]